MSHDNIIYEDRPRKGTDYNQGETSLNLWDDIQYTFAGRLSFYRQLLGMNKTELSKLLGRGFSIGYLSQLERGLVSPPKRREKLEYMAERIAYKLAEKLPQSDTIQLKDNIFREFEIATNKHIPADAHSDKILFGTMALLLTGDTSNTGVIRNIIKASQSQGDFLNMVVRMFPEAEKYRHLFSSSSA